MSMAASVELRPPFLDQNVVEFALALPSRMKVRRGVGKWILREVARSYVAPEVLNRPKIGFRVPLDDWFRRDLREMAHELLTGSEGFVANYMSKPLVSDLLERHGKGIANEEIRLWTLMSLEVWHSAYFGSKT
jgi:asparagine synthase (glutamine-hydrolysing)